MKSATELINDEQRKRVEAAVVAAEAKTSCEIVPVVATSSGRYDRPEDMIGLWLAILAAITVWVMLPRQLDETGSWSGLPIYVGLLTMVASVVVAFIAGASIGSRIGWLRRLFTPRQQMQEEVYARARQTFFDKRIHHTTGSTGLLIYVSLFEHIAVVLGDQEIIDKLGQSFLDQLCEQLTEGLRQGDASEAICNVISAAGEKLAGPLPRTTDDVNELHDALVLID
ncbi:TPM domain-containing protein [Rosistilla oblonga]|uniref:TPM domain-containing protein n=1 Tax=Rosistilla oblonga TaxID=2527990 RepID=UPI003A986155